MQKSETALFDDEEITSAIEEYDDPDHPEASTLSEIREILDYVQTSTEHYWEEMLDAIGGKSHSLVHADEEVIVLADHTGHEWNEVFAQADVEDDVTQDVVMGVHLKRAKKYEDDVSLWGVADPFVVKKSDTIRDKHDRRESLPDQL